MELKIKTQKKEIQEGYKEIIEEEEKIIKN